jgi:Mn2+/Fe2+ NRAMP family transporter
MKYILFLCFATRYFESETSPNKNWAYGREVTTLYTIIFYIIANCYYFLFFDDNFHSIYENYIIALGVGTPIIISCLLRLYLNRKGLIKKYYREFYSFEHRIKAQYTIGAFAIVIFLFLNLSFGEIIFDILMKAYFS